MQTSDVIASQNKRMNQVTVEISQGECRVNIILTATTLREDAIQTLDSETVEDESSIDAVQIAVPISLQSVSTVRTVIPVQETNKLASGELVLSKII